MEKYKCLLYRYSIFMLMIFIIIVLQCSIFNIYNPIINLQPVVIFIGVIVELFLFISIKKFIKKIPESKSNIIAVSMCIVFFIMMSLFGNFLTSIPIVDLRHIQVEALTMINNGGKFTNVDYYAQYTNQVPSTILVFFIYKIGSIFNIINLKGFATVINSFFIAITAFFVYLSVKRIKNYTYGLLTTIFFIANPIFYFYTSYFYTDTLCMPFAAIGTYLIILFKTTKSTSKTKLISMLVFSGIALAIGFEIRVVVGFILLAFIITQFLEKKTELRKTIVIASIILGFIGGIGMYMLICIPFNVPKDKEKEFPITHWIMYSVNEKSDGKYNVEDWNYTNARKSYNEKQNANTDIIKQRLEKMGLKGWISLTKTKLAVNWSNGSYNYTPDVLYNVEHINIMYDYVSGNKKIFVLYYCQICKAVIFATMLFVCLKELFKRRHESSYNFMCISLLIAFVFYLIWEVKSKYSLCFLPWMIILFPLGIEVFEKIVGITNIEFGAKKITRDTIHKVIKKATVFVFIWSLVLLLINYYPYAIKKSQYNDRKVFQGTGSDLISVSNNTIEQQFETDKTFNKITLKFSNKNQNDKVKCKVKLVDEEKKVISEETITLGAKEEANKGFKFDYVKPKGKQKYTIQVSSKDKNVYLVGFKDDTYKVYPYGNLKINDVNTNDSLTFTVGKNTERSYVSPLVYCLISFMIIIIEIIAFYPYWRKEF